MTATGIWRSGTTSSTQFDNDGEGHYTELEQKNIDTGMGLERLAVVCQNVDSLFDVDTVMNITNKVSDITGAHYGESQARPTCPCGSSPTTSAPPPL